VLQGIPLSGIVPVILIAVSIVIIIGFLSSYQFARTGFPDILFLILLGYLAGPVLRFVELEEVTVFAPYLTVVATILILFEGGLAMNVRKIVKEAPRALALTVFVFFFSTVAVTWFMMFLGFDIFQGALLGVMISGNSAIVIIPLVNRIEVSDETVTVVSLESALSGIFSIVSFLAVIDILQAGHIDALVVVQDVAARFCVGAVIGLIMGVFWLNALKEIKKEVFAYMLTLAVLLLTYYASEYLGGSGALTALLFGVVLGNEWEVFRIVHRNAETMVIDESIVRFESELAFLVRTFFFVYIGLTLRITDVSAIISGAAVSILLLGARIAGSYLATIGSPLKHERYLISIVLSRGLDEAVLSVLLISYGFPFAELFKNIAFLVIILTNILCTIGVYILTKESKR
jgi:cell volume regulation protein A